ncbi:WecB/TagA/CpsF family glycosyltransferase [Marinoscillum sp.]|uniref:WecB/TagA/CpsF family glycosyltransferase n=1 Tax=Marinoscillum sp. TaxID=2024838 RepID=UPI003BA9F393
MNIANTLDWFKSFLNNADVNFCDGEGVRIAGQILGQKIPEKITYNRWIWQLAERSSRKGHSWFIIGSEAPTIAAAFSVLKKKYPKLDLLDCHDGFIKDEKTLRELKYKINELKPDLLILGMGMPFQEDFLIKNANELDFGIALTGGAVFEYISGNAKMTPEIFYKLKMEWFYRFMQEPGRLFKRYFVGNFVFFLRVFRRKLRKI